MVSVRITFFLSCSWFGLWIPWHHPCLKLAHTWERRQAIKIVLHLPNSASRRLLNRLKKFCWAPNFSFPSLTPHFSPCNWVQGAHFSPRSWKVTKKFAPNHQNPSQFSAVLLFKYWPRSWHSLIKGGLGLAQKYTNIRVKRMCNFMQKVVCKQSSNHRYWSNVV